MNIYFPLKTKKKKTHRIPLHLQESYLTHYSPALYNAGQFRKSSIDVGRTPEATQEFTVCSHRQNEETRMFRSLGLK